MERIILEQLLRLEPVFDFLFSFLDIAGSVDEIRHAYILSISVCERHMRVIASDGSWNRNLRFGGSYDLADIFYDLDAFEDDSDHRSLLHHLERHIERLLSTPGNHLSEVLIVMIKEFLIWPEHLHAHDMQSCPFETGDDLSRDAASYAIRLQDNQSSLYMSHFLFKYKKIKDFLEYYCFAGYFQAQLHTIFRLKSPVH